jgi:hypothetical protein
MSGESPREEKCVERNWGGSIADPSHFHACGITTAPATVPAQASRQQLIECWPFGQQESRDAFECEIAAVWQFVAIKVETPANATADPCRPMASITRIAMN